MLEDFLSKLGASTRITVGVSVSPSVGLEMIEIDRLTGSVNKYANKPLEYNHSTREIADYEKFRIALEELFNELHIPKKTNIVLSLPNVQFGVMSLPILLTDDAITNAIISEVEQSYIFKRQEPIVGWYEINNNIDTEKKFLVYTAIQQGALEEITEICKDIGCSIISIESNYSHLLKALHYTGLAKEQMKEKTTWNLMIIGQNNYSIISMMDKRIIEYYEEPLALKSFVNDEIYNAITISAQLTLSNIPASHLLIVSETDLVSAEVLALKIPVESTVNFVECNKFTQNELLPVNLNVLPKNAIQVTLEAIGAAIYQFCDYPLRLNVLKNSVSDSFDEAAEIPKINIGNLEIELTPDFIQRLAFIIGGVLLTPMLIIALILTQIVIPKEQARLDLINNKIQQLNTEISKYEHNKNSSFDLNSTMERIAEQNKLKLTYYSALGISIPGKLWVTGYLMNESGKIDIKGKAGDVKSVYDFYKDLKQLINNSDIRLYKLEIESGSLDDIVIEISTSKTYIFEITNMAEAELNPQESKDNSNQQQNPPPEINKQPIPSNRGLFGGEKPLFAPPNPIKNPFGGGNEKLPENLEKIEKF